MQRSAVQTHQDHISHKHIAHIDKTLEAGTNAQTRVWINHHKLLALFPPAFAISWAFAYTILKYQNVRSYYIMLCVLLVCANFWFLECNRCSHSQTAAQWTSIWICTGEISMKLKVKLVENFHFNDQIIPSVSHSSAQLRKETNKRERLFYKLWLYSLDTTRGWRKCVGKRGVNFCVMKNTHSINVNDVEHFNHFRSPNSYGSVRNLLHFCHHSFRFLSACPTTVICMSVRAKIHDITIRVFQNN